MSDSSSPGVLAELASAPDFCTAVQRLTDWAQDLTGCQAAMLRFREDDTESEGWIPAFAQRGFDCRFLQSELLIGQEECLCGQVCRGCSEEDSQLFNSNGSFSSGGVQEAVQQHALAALDNIRGRCIAEGFESLAIIPLAGEDGTPIGCLHLADSARDKFGGHLRTLEDVCRRSGPVLLGFSPGDRETCLIQAVETALAPPELVQVPGLDITVSFCSATESAHLGGDFYDVIKLDGDRVLLVVGDYSGRGIGAAGMAARARHAIAGAAESTDDPGELLAAAQESLASSLPLGKFVTVAACLHHPDGTLHCALAGHPPPMVLGPGDQARELDLPPNMPLGFFEGNRLLTGSTRLRAEQTLLLFTDGVVEARRDGRLFGVEGIATHWRSARKATINDLAKGICRASAEFNARNNEADDRLVLAARRTRSY
jgi:hypothetical protein